MERKGFALERMEPWGREAAAAALRDIGCTEAGVEIMRDKAVFSVVRVHDLPTKAANVVKQTFLSKGADAAVSRHAVDLSEERTDVLLFATLAQYREATAVLERQPWGLAVLAADLRVLLGI
ncbi:dihydropteroate synthase [Selenomonas sputigena]|uniref:Dihydropteroate synthase n=1 Tax=Selenomonas sputigena TaxID=69823 RepID=A0ABV3X794_9FIRM